MQCTNSPFNQILVTTALIFFSFASIQHLDISGNELIGFVPPMLCKKSGINGNGYGGELRCEVVACEVGTHSSIGRADSSSDGIKCSPCTNENAVSNYLGSKSCSNHLVKEQSIHYLQKQSSGEAILIVICIFSAVMIGFIIRRRYEYQHASEMIYDDFNFSSNDVSRSSQQYITNTPEVLQEEAPLALEEVQIKSGIIYKMQNQEVRLDVPEIS